MRKLIRILLAETAPVVSEGLTGIIKQSELKAQIALAASWEEMELNLARDNFDLVILNPLFIQFETRKFSLLKGQHPKIRFAALQYTYIEQKIVKMFDAVIHISDTPDVIVNSVEKLFSYVPAGVHGVSQEILSERETEVLRLLAFGLANKEIADKLNISTNTVITHRKNISQKTGIKSVSGLTIFAVAQQIVSIENFREKKM